MGIRDLGPFFEQVQKEKENKSRILYQLCMRYCPQVNLNEVLPHTHPPPPPPPPLPGNEATGNISD